MGTTIRLDKWLWATRFFKTRRLAAEAVAGGKVHLNGHRVKPGRSMNTGDSLSIRRGDYFYEISVLAVNSQRRPASEACLLYEETESSKQARQKQAEMQRLVSSSYQSVKRKPNKRERDRIIRFKRKLV